MKKIILIGLFVLPIIMLNSCNTSTSQTLAKETSDDEAYITIDTTKIPQGPFGESVRYGRELMLNTSYYIGPEGINGKYLGNKMNCTNCHQDAGTKPHSFNLLASHDNYPQYRGRENKVLTMAERVNNCVMRPHSGKPLPLDSKEMVAFLSYFKWINQFVPKDGNFKGNKNLKITFPDVAASPERGKILYADNCVRCHGDNGEGQYKEDKSGYIYPPLWGEYAYQPGSSMHRVIKQAEWLKSNMPFDKVTPGKPFLTDAEALDIAAYVNDDAIHPRPNPKTFDYPDIMSKPLDYSHAPFKDNFTEAQHKYGPYKPIIAFWEKNGWKATY